MKRWIIVLFILIMFSGSFLQAKIPDIERQALIALYNSTNGDNWYRKDNWKKADGSFNDPGTENTWDGITCDDSNTTVVSLELPACYLYGTIPEEIGNLKDLKKLDLRSNDLGGAIPITLGKMVKLEYLLLGGCEFSGPIPEELANLVNLKTLNLSDNHLSGQQILGNLTNLEYLYLAFTGFYGSIPESFTNLINLKGLDLYGNDNLTGNIPSFIGSLSKLEFLNLDSCNFSGEIPWQMGNLKNLKYLHLEGNNLTGSIPWQLGKLSKLLDCMLGWNELSGEIPAQLGNLSKLDRLGLTDNDLSGPIPKELENMSALVNLQFEQNHLSGNIPAELGNLDNVCEFDVSDNRLSGKVPDDLAKLGDNDCWTGGPDCCDEILDISYNALEGSDYLKKALEWTSVGWTSQALPPKNVKAYKDSRNRIMILWDNNDLEYLNGIFQIYYSRTSGGTYTIIGRTNDLSTNHFFIENLPSGANYFFIVRTKTITAKNTLVSKPSREATLEKGKMITGSIKFASKPLSGVSLIGLPGHIETDVNGRYTGIVPTGWSGTVKPIKSDFAFKPVSRSYRHINQDQINRNYEAKEKLKRISVYIENTKGVLLQGLPGDPVTDDNGFYSCQVAKGWSGTIKPVKEVWRFDPPFVTISNLDNDIIVNFFATSNVSVRVWVSRQVEKSWLIKKEVGRIDISGYTSDTIPNIKSVIYRQISPEKDYQPIHETFPTIDSLNDWNYSYFDKYLEKEKVYKYKVVVYNQAGEIMAVSQEITI